MSSTSSADTANTLKNFDSLPNSAHVREPVVTALFACSRATLWRHVKNSKMPAPKKLAGITAWRVGDLRAYLEATA